MVSTVDDEEYAYDTGDVWEAEEEDGLVALPLEEVLDDTKDEY